MAFTGAADGVDVVGVGVAVVGVGVGVALVAETVGVGVGAGALLTCTPNSEHPLSARPRTPAPARADLRRARRTEVLDVAAITSSMVTPSRSRFSNDAPKVPRSGRGRAVICGFGSGFRRRVGSILDAQFHAGQQVTQPAMATGGD